MKLKFFKGLLMMALGVILAAFKSDNIDWPVIFLTVLGMGIVYIAKNRYMLTSTSMQGSFDANDWLSLFIISIGTAISNSIATMVIQGCSSWMVWQCIDWPQMGKMILGIAGGYFSTTLYQGSK
jgi:hypothetical protein